jgi:hypothetical protein
MALLPKDPHDLVLAPVAAHIDQNLARIRDMSEEQIAADLVLQLNDSPLSDDADERADRVRTVALRLVDMHGWEAEISADRSRLRLTGGSVPIELGLSATIHDYIVG